MDLRIVGLRIKEAREAKNLTQEDLAALVDLSPTHISVIERGLKAVKLDKFVAIANALDVSADRLLVDVVTRSVDEWQMNCRRLLRSSRRTSKRE